MGNKGVNSELRVVMQQYCNQESNRSPFDHKSDAQIMDGTFKTHLPASEITRKARDINYPIRQ